MRVYVDAFLVINFLVDFLLLLGTNRLTGFPDNKKRMAMSSLLGALYSGACLLPEFRFLGNTLWRAVSLGLMGMAAFGWNRSAVPRSCVFLLLSLALGGLALSLGRSDIRGLMLAGLGIWCLCRLCGQSVSGARDYLPLEICCGDRRVKLLALRDTGNTLRDPVTGEQVLVVSPAAAARLTGLTQQQLAHPMETLASRCLPGLRLIPYRTVGQSGMMLAMKFDQVYIDGRRKESVVAFSPENFDRSEAYQALTGGVTW